MICYVEIARHSLYLRRHDWNHSWKPPSNSCSS